MIELLRRWIESLKGAYEETFPSLEEASSPETSATRLVALASQSELLAKVIAGNPAAPADLLESLAKKHGPDFVEIVVKNPNTPVPFLITNASAHPRAFFENPILPILLLEDPTFWKRFNDNQLASMAKASNAETSFLVYLSEKNFYTKRLAAENPNTPPDILKRLLCSELKDVSTAASKNPSLPDNLHARLSSLTQTATYLPEPELNELAALGHWPRVWVCASVRAPLAVVRQLLHRFPADACLGALTNPALPADFLDELLQHFKRAAANTPMKDQILAAIAKHPSCTAQQIKLLATMHGLNVQGAVAASPLLQEEDQRRLLGSFYVEVRSILARRSGLSSAMQLSLREDLEGQVQNALAERYPQTVESAKLWRKQMTDGALSEGELRAHAKAGPRALFDIFLNEKTPSSLRRELALQLPERAAHRILYANLPLIAMEDLIEAKAPMCAVLARRAGLPPHMVERLVKMSRAVQDALFSRPKTLELCELLLVHDFEPAAEPLLSMAPPKTREQLMLVLSKIPKPWKKLCVLLCAEPNLPKEALPLLLPRFWQHLSHHPNVKEWAKDPTLFALFPRAMKEIVEKK